MIKKNRSKLCQADERDRNNIIKTCVKRALRKQNHKNAKVLKNSEFSFFQRNILKNNGLMFVLKVFKTLAKA